MKAKAACPILTTSWHPGAELYAEDVSLRADGVSFTAVLGEERAKVSLPIPGSFAVSNGLTVLGLAAVLGIPLSQAAAALSEAKA